MMNLNGGEKMKAIVKVEEKKEKLDTHKDIPLGERDVHVNYHHVVGYTIYSHKGKIFYVRFVSVINGEYKETIRVIKRQTAITMLSRMNNINECKIRENIPDFKNERLKIQLFDRLNDYEQILPDEKIEEKLNKVESFHFKGQQGYCGRDYPHLPHSFGHYETPRYGILEEYCAGKSGDLLLSNGKKVEIKITRPKVCNGDCYGNYVVLELKDE